MLTNLFTHTAAVSRNTGTAFTPSWTTVVASLACLIEPLNGKMIETLTGKMIQGHYQLTWGTDDVRDNDRVVPISGPMRAVGVTFILAESKDDTGRASNQYQTGILTSKPAGTS